MPEVSNYDLHAIQELALCTRAFLEAIRGYKNDYGDPIEGTPEYAELMKMLDGDAL